MGIKIVPVRTGIKISSVRMGIKTSDILDILFFFKVTTATVASDRSCDVCWRH